MIDLKIQLIREPWVILIDLLIPWQVREAEILVSTLVEEGERRATEAERLQQELIRARIAEKQAKEKLGSFITTLNGSICHSVANSTTLNASTLLNATSSLLHSSTPHLPASSASISHG